MKDFIVLFINGFGYENINDLGSSMFNKKLLFILIPAAGILPFIEDILGIQFLTVFAFLLAMFLEVATGMGASFKEGKQITSRKFSRFGLKAFIWFAFLFIINAFRLQYQDDNYLTAQFWEWTHSAFLSYITLEYLISIDENITRMTGKKSGFIQVLKRKFNKSFFDDDSDPDDKKVDETAPQG